MSNIPGGINYEDKVLASLNKLLGQKDELANSVKELFHQQQLHETRTAAQFERFSEMFKGVNSRLSRIEEEVESTTKTRYQSLYVKNDKFRENMFKALGALFLATLGGVLSWLIRK